MHAIFLVLIASLCCFNAFAQTLELKNITLGISEKELHGKYPLLKCENSKDTSSDRTCSLGPQKNSMLDLATLADKPVQNWKFYFIEEKGLGMVIASFRSEYFDPVFDALAKKYGTPPIHNSEVFTKGGTQYKKYMFAWHEDNRSLVVRSRDDEKITTVQLFDTKLTEKSKKADDLTKKAVKDI